MSFNPTEVLRVALYARVSTEEQKEGQTIDSQIAELERFARDKGWQITGTYKDEGWSGSLLARPELDRLRDDASKKLFGIVLVNDVDRLARDVSHLGIVKRDLEKCGTQVVFRKLPAEKSPTYNLMVNILGSFAEFEREMIIDRTRRGRRHKVEVRQQFLGSNAPFGYRYVQKDKASGSIDNFIAIMSPQIYTPKWREYGTATKISVARTD
jgi:site-specific DNA recombinase